MTNSPSEALIDADVIKYKAAAAGQKNSILATHPSGLTETFDNRTEFWGHHSKKNGGWLSLHNLTRTSPLLPEEWTIEDVVDPEPVQNVLHTVKMMYQHFATVAGTKKAKGFIGKGKTFRLDRSTIKEYKGNRATLVPPYHLEAVIDYLERVLRCTVVEGIETDDRLVMEAYKRPDRVVVGVDKDYYGCPVNFFNVDKPESGIIQGNNFGQLWIDDKRKVGGYGRQFLYWQVASGDSSDNYKANSASEKRWGDVAAFEMLRECTNDKESWKALVETYKFLYPEPKTITGWRGDYVQIDWLYVLQENFDLARMLRWEGDEVKVVDVLTKLGIDYE